MTDLEAFEICRDADRWVDEDTIMLYRAAEHLAEYVVTMGVVPRD